MRRKNGFHQFQPDEDLSFWTTSYTTLRTFRQTRFPLGAPEIWQRRMNESVEELTSGEVIANDFLIADVGRNEEGVNTSLGRKEREFFEKCRQCNLKAEQE